MAFTLKYFAQMGFMDSRAKATVREFNVSAADAEAWLTAADAAARAATALGVFFANLEAHTDCEILYRRVIKGDVEQAVVAPSSEQATYNYDVFLVSMYDGVNPGSFTIPGRRTAAVDFASNGFEVLWDGEGQQETQDLADDINDVLVHPISGNAMAVRSIKASR